MLGSVAAQLGHKRFPRTLLPSRLGARSGLGHQGRSLASCWKGWTHWALLEVSCGHQEKEFCALDPWSGLRSHSELVGQGQPHSHGGFTWVAAPYAPLHLNFGCRRGRNSLWGHVGTRNSFLGQRFQCDLAIPGSWLSLLLLFPAEIFINTLYKQEF